jgi:hypothetical protein
MTIIAIPLNTKGTAVIINGISTLEHFWSTIISTAHAVYDNHGFNDDDKDDQAYREAEIFNQLENQTELGSLDLVVVAMFAYHQPETIHRLIKHGENKDWEFTTQHA